MNKELSKIVEAYSKINEAKQQVYENDWNGTFEKFVEEFSKDFEKDGWQIDNNYFTYDFDSNTSAMIYPSHSVIRGGLSKREGNIQVAFFVTDKDNKVIKHEKVDIPMVSFPLDDVKSTVLRVKEAVKGLTDEYLDYVESRLKKYENLKKELKKF